MYALKSPMPQIMSTTTLWWTSPSGISVTGILLKALHILKCGGLCPFNFSFGGWYSPPALLPKCFVSDHGCIAL